MHVREKEHKPGELGFTFLVFLFGALGYWFALDLSNDSYASPAIFPKMASILIMAGSLISLCRAARRGRDASTSRQNAASYLLNSTVLVMLILMILYCLLLPVLHFPLTSFLFLVTSLTFLYRGRHFLRLCLFAALLLACMIFLFRYILLVIIP